MGRTAFMVPSRPRPRRFYPYMVRSESLASPMVTEAS